MVFAQGPRHTGAAFVNGPAGDRVSGKAVARAVRGLSGQVSGDNGGVHNFSFLGQGLGQQAGLGQRGKEFFYSLGRTIHRSRVCGHGLLPY